MLHSHVDNSAPLLPILSHMKRVQTLPPYFFKINFNIIIQFTPKPSMLPLSLQIFLPSSFVNFSTTRATCSAHPFSLSISINLTTQSSTLYSFLPFPFACSTLCLNAPHPPSTLFLDTLNLYSSITMKDQVSRPSKQHDKLYCNFVAFKDKLNTKTTISC